MDSIFERLQAFVKDLQARFNNLSTPSKFLAGLAIFTLLPCVAVCNTNWKSWAKALTCFFLFCFMLGILMVAFVFYLIWFIWKKTSWKTYLKAVVTVVIIVVPVTLGILFGERPVPSNVPATPSSSETQIMSDATPPVNETVPPATQPPIEETPSADIATEPIVYTVGGVDYYDFEGLIEVGSIIYIKDGDNMIPYLEVLDFGENEQNPGGTPISNAVYVKELYSVFGDTSTVWRDLDEMLRHNEETREDEGSPVYYVEVPR